jgi:hypothetical protein
MVGKITLTAEQLKIADKYRPAQAPSGTSNGAATYAYALEMMKRQDEAKRKAQQVSGYAAAKNMVEEARAEQQQRLKTGAYDRYMNTYGGYLAGAARDAVEEAREEQQTRLQTGADARRETYAQALQDLIAEQKAEVVRLQRQVASSWQNPASAAENRALYDAAAKELKDLQERYGAIGQKNLRADLDKSLEKTKGAQESAVKISQNALMMGADEIGMLAASALNAPLDIIGWKNNPIAAWKNRLQKAQENNLQVVAERSTPMEKMISDIGAMVVQAIPQAAAAIATSGTSLVGTAALEAAAAGQAAVTGARMTVAAKNLATTIGTAMRALSKDPQYWLAFSQVAGNNYEQAKADGADTLKASAYALTNGLLNAMVEVGGGGIQELPAQLRSGGASTVRRWVETMLDEGKEEVVQGVIERLMQNVSYGKENPIASTTDQNAVFNPGTAVKEFSGGALVGGILGGGQMYASLPTINEILARQYEEATGKKALTAPPQTQAAPVAKETPAGRVNTPTAGTGAQAGTERATDENAAYEQAVKERENQIDALEAAAEKEKAAYISLYNEFKGTTAETRRPELIAEAQAQQKKVEQAEVAAQQARAALKDFRAKHEAESAQKQKAAEQRKRQEAQAAKLRDDVAQAAFLVSDYEGRFISEDALKSLENLGVMKKETAALRAAYDKATALQEKENGMMKRMNETFDLKEAISLRKEMATVSDQITEAADAVTQAQERVLQKAEEYYRNAGRPGYAMAEETAAGRDNTAARGNAAQKGAQSAENEGGETNAAGIDRGGYIRERGTGEPGGESGTGAVRGDVLPDGGGKRDAGQGAREPSGRVADRAGRNQKRTKRTDARRTSDDRQNSLKDLRSGGNRWVVTKDAKSQGIRSGTDTKKAVFLPEYGTDPEIDDFIDNDPALRELLDKAEEDGRVVHLFAGVLEVQGKSGTKATARGAWQDGEVWVRINDPVYEPMQIYDHESLHDMIGADKALESRLIGLLKSRMTKEEIDALLTEYAEQHRGAVDPADTAALYNEILADAYAGMGAFKDGKYQDLTSEVRQTVESSTGERSAQIGVERATGPPALSVVEEEVGYPVDRKALYTDPNLYNYDFMTSQPDMVVTELPDLGDLLGSDGKVDRATVEADGLANAAQQGYERNGRLYVENDYTGRKLRINPNTTTHSVRGSAFQIGTNGRLGAAAGEIVRRAIPVNGMTNRNSQTQGTYAMAAYARDKNGRGYIAVVTVEQMTDKVSDIGFFDVAHAISGRIRKETPGSTRSRAVTAEADPDPRKSPTISIADFLDIVNGTHQSILSQDVLNHFNAQRDEGSYWGSRALFSEGGVDTEGDIFAQEEEPEKKYGLPTKEDIWREEDERVMKRLLRKAWQPMADYAGYDIVPEGLIESIIKNPEAEPKHGKITKEKMTQFAVFEGYPVLNGRQVVPGYTWVRAEDRGNYGRVLGKNGSDLSVLFWNKKESAKVGSDVTALKDIPLSELTVVDAEYQDLDKKEKAEALKEPEAAEENRQDEESPFTVEDLQKWADEAEAATNARKKNVDAQADRVLRQALGKLAPGKLANMSEESPLELEEVKNLLAETGDEILWTDVAGDPAIYDFAQGIQTGKGGNYNRTLSMNLDDAAGKNQKLRELMRTMIEKPFYDAKDNYSNEVKTRLNDLYDTVVDEMGIKPGTKESAAVQWYGEGVRQGKYSGLPPTEKADYNLELLKKQFPEKWQDIKKAAEYMRKQYDEYIERINSSMEKIYPRVMERAEADQAKYKATEEYFLRQAWRQGELAQTVQRTIDRKKAQLKDAKKGTQAYVSLENSIEYNKKRLAAIEAKAERLKTRSARARTAADNIRKNIESGDILKNKRLTPRKDYFHHFREMENGIGGLLDLIATPSEIDASLAGASEFTKPKTKWAGFMQKRSGAVMDADAVGGMLRYIPAAEYKVNLDPIIARGRSQIKLMADATADTRNANKFLVWYTDWVNQLAGKTNPFDRPFQKLFSRKSMRGLMWLNNRVKGNAIVGSMRSAVAQFYNLPNSISLIKSPKDWAKGNEMALQDLFGREDARSVFEKSGFLRERYLDRTMSRFEEGILRAPKKMATWMLRFGDEQVARVTWAAAYEKGVRLKEADPIAYADELTRRAIAGRGIGEVPLVQEAQITKFVAPFQVEVNNQFQLLKDLFKKKDALAVIFMFLASFLMNELTRKLGGFDVSFDPINAMMEGIEDWDEEENAWINTMGVIGRLTGEVMGNMAYGQQIASILVSDETKREKFFGESDPTRYGTGNIGINMLADPLIALLNGDKFAPDLLSAALNIGMPWGGKQTERIVKALQMYGLLPVISASTKDGVKVYFQKGGGASYSAGGGLRFAADSTVGNILRTIWVGEFGTKEGMEYLENDRMPLSAEKTEMFRDLTEMGADTTEAFEAITGLAKIKSDKMTPDGETISGFTEYSDEEAKEKGWETVTGSKEYNSLEYIDGLNLSEKQKLYLYAAAIASDSRLEDLQAFEDAGMNWSDIYGTVKKYLDLSGTGGEDLTANEKKASMVTWAIGNLTPEQVEVVRDSLVYTTTMKDDLDSYDKYLTLGIAPDGTLRLMLAFGDLEPEKGKAAVSDIQRYREIEGADYLNADEKLAAIGVVMGTEMKTESGNPSEWAKLQNCLKSGLALDEYLDLKEDDNVERYLKIKEAGASASAAQKIAAALGKLEPAEKDGSVTDRQRYEAIVKTNVPEKDQKAAFASVADDSTEYRLGLAYGYDVAPKDYVLFLQTLYNLDSSGNFSQDEVTAALRSMLGLSNEARAALWQIQTGGKNGQNNPFSRTIGKAIYDKYESWKDGQK